MSSKKFVNLFFPHYNRHGYASFSVEAIKQHFVEQKKNETRKF